MLGPMTYGVLSIPTGAAPSDLLTDLVAYWKLDEASGTRADSHGSNDLADNNTVTQAVGKVGNAAQFTAANTEFLSSVDNADLSVGDIGFMFAGWCYPDSADNGELVSKGVVGTAGAEYRVLFTSGRKITFQVQNAAGTFKGVTTTVTLTLETWSFWVVWHDPDADTINIQVDNGTPVSATTDGIVPHDGTSEFRMGRGFALFNGRIDEVGFWKRILTTDERTQLYNSGNGATYPDF